MVDGNVVFCHSPSVVVCCAIVVGRRWSAVFRFVPAPSRVLSHSLILLLSLSLHLLSLSLSNCNIAERLPSTLFLFIRSLSSCLASAFVCLRLLCVLVLGCLHWLLLLHIQRHPPRGCSSFLHSPLSVVSHASPAPDPAVPPSLSVQCGVVWSSCHGCSVLCLLVGFGGVLFGAYVLGALIGAV